ncbi:MAG: acetyl-CoA hydrolase/transferase C-terminal domain-containing protein [Thermodesulfobacteriota bacterium]|nr:acetyl-CoA hydrolase/transferase C-terminal domain-containing protein [Thermodesulfobacteriota bacterium]
MVDWQKEFEKKLVSAEEAAKTVKSGDTVVFTTGREAHAVGLAIAARVGELKDVSVFAPTPGYDFGWYDEGWQDSFKITIVMPTATCQEAVDAKRVDVVLGSPVSMYRSNMLSLGADVVLTEVSPPDEKGFCSFGQSLWNKREQITIGKTVIAEVNDRLIRTYGANYVHVSEIDYFVEHMRSGGQIGKGSLAGRALKEPRPYLKNIAEHINEIINDGDTIQIGVGRTTEPLVRLGMLDGKKDLGMHSEATPPGIITLVKEGVITGKYKTTNPHKVVVTSLGGGSKEEMLWASNNPLFELVALDYLEDIQVIASHDNMVAINNSLAIDFSGQSTAETLGERRVSATGGQFPFVLGALMSKGGRSIQVLPSTARGGEVSRIMPRLPEGTIITTHYACADYVVTEYGVAKLWGTTTRQRAKSLISIAHPDFRDELTAEALRMFG